MKKRRIATSFVSSLISLIVLILLPKEELIYTIWLMMKHRDELPRLLPYLWRVEPTRLLAVGIFEEATEHKGHPVRIIFFMALPEQSDADDMLMIRVYDELLEISRDTDMLDAIVRTQTWPELMRVLYKKA